MVCGVSSTKYDFQMRNNGTAQVVSTTVSPHGRRSVSFLFSCSSSSSWLGVLGAYIRTRTRSLHMSYVFTCAGTILGQPQQQQQHTHKNQPQRDTKNAVFLFCCCCCCFCGLMNAYDSDRNDAAVVVVAVVAVAAAQ